MSDERAEQYLLMLWLVTGKQLTAIVHNFNCNPIKKQSTHPFSTSMCRLFRIIISLCIRVHTAQNIVYSKVSHKYTEERQQHKTVKIGWSS